MAQTPNLKLNLFNGSDKPNYELFNDNNLKIDEVLNNAKTHNHDGINSSKIKATNVVFNSGDTTLNANNLEDAVKEVFTEADNKITWITNAIGKTSTGVSNPDIKADEIKADFDTAREKYLNNVKNYTLFNLNGYSVNSTSSINDVAEAINNTTFKEATATKDDMLTSAHGITKNGIVEYGTIEPIDYLMAKPSAERAVTIDKGMYKELFLPAMSVDNPAFHIKKGKSILGIQGMLLDHGSNGWDIGESIPKNKLDTLNTNSIFYKKKSGGTGIYSSIATPVTIKKDNGTFIDVQHFRLVNGKIECYTSDLKEYYTVDFTTVDSSINSSGSIQQNNITTKKMFKVFKQYDKLYAAIAYKNRIFIVDILSKSIFYKYPASTSSNLNMNISEILIPKNFSGSTYNICFIGEGGYIACKPVYNSLGTEIEKWIGHKKHDLDFYYTRETEGAVTLIPKETVTEEQTSSFSTKVTKANLTVEDGYITLSAGDKLKISKYLAKHSTIELIYSVPMGGGQATLQVLDDEDGLIEQIQTSSTATTVKSIRIGSNSEITLSCTQNKIRITGIKVAEAGYADTRNKLFSTDWGYLGSRAIYNTVEVKGTEDEAYLLYGGHEKSLDEGKSTAIFAVAKFTAINSIDNISLFNLGQKLIVDDMYAGKDGEYLETLRIHKCLSFMSEYDNYIYGTFPDMRYINSTVSATGTRYHKFNRRLIKLDITKSGLALVLNQAKPVLTESTKSFGYKLFRPMFINHLGQIIGLEQSCTLEKFTYVTKLNSNLLSTDALEDWSETEWRTAEEEFNILDDGNAFNRIKMLQSVVRLYGTNGSISNTKLVGTILTGSNDNVRSTQASMTYDNSDTSVIYTTEQGLLSIYNPVYKINAPRE